MARPIAKHPLCACFLIKEKDLAAFLEIDWLISTLKGLIDHAADLRAHGGIDETYGARGSRIRVVNLEERLAAGCRAGRAAGCVFALW